MLSHLLYGTKLGIHRGQEEVPDCDAEHDTSNDWNDVHPECLERLLCLCKRITLSIPSHRSKNYAADMC